MPPPIAEYRDHEVGRTVHHLGSVEKCRVGIDETAEPNHARDPVKISSRRLDLRQYVNGAAASGFLALLERHLPSELTLGHELAVWAEADLARYERQRAH